MGQSASGQTISPAFVHLLREYLRPLGLDERRILGKTAAQELSQAKTGFPMSRWEKMLQRASQALRDPKLGLRLGQTIQPRHLGTIGFLLQSQPTLGAALQKFQRYQRLVYGPTPMLQLVETEYVDLVWGIGHGQPGRLVDDASITALIYYCRAIAEGPVVPQCVHFVNQAPDDAHAYRAAYGCAVEFTCPVTRVRFNVETLAQPLRSANSELATLMEQQTESLLARWPSASEPFVSRVRTAAGALLHDGEPTLCRVAQRLGVSTRTAQRRLQAADTSFRIELESVRRQMASIYLRDRRLSVADIALLLGYSEHSALTRTYRQWTGKTPRAGR